MHYKKEKMNLCSQFFNELARRLENDYEIVESCNHDDSRYLVPVGTKEQITYNGKPVGSFRISDHWNWYSNTRKCSDPIKVQCDSVDMPRARRRDVEGVGTKPRFGAQVAIYGLDGQYHHVYGERFNRKYKTWIWEEGTISEALRLLKMC